MDRPNDVRAFRCTVPPENSAAKLKVKNKWHDVAVLDTSRSGFSVRVGGGIARKLKAGQTYQLKFNGEHWRVEQESNFSDTGGDSTIGFSRIEELTKIKLPSTPWTAYVSKTSSQTDPTFLFFLMIVFLIACISLPGVGDNLGTAPKVRDGVKAAIDTFKEAIN